MVLEQYVEDYLDNFENVEIARWNYPYGCIALGYKMIYEATKDERYLKPVKIFAERYVGEDGKIKGYDAGEQNVDLMSSGKLLIFLYKLTGEKRFLNGIEYVIENLRKQPRTKGGNFWHKNIYPNQVWLDGLYMVQPLYLEYEVLFNNGKNFDDIISQFKNVRKLMFDENKQLYYHGYDESREVYWADKKTGLSKSFWLRSIGWYVMALVDCYETMPSENEEYRKLFKDQLIEIIEGLLLYQDKKTKLFYQVIDKIDTTGNYLETSGSGMIAYAMMKGSRLGMLDKDKYFDMGQRILMAIESENIEADNGRFHVVNVCGSAGLGPFDDPRRDGTVEYYLSEPIKPDNYHGVAACVLAYGEWLKNKES
jgi:Predicted unsaturated glucuronyl hydrolase involved in regulation of bacterial surface properties, and related proteins